jgi:hypothetical protein
MNGQTSGASLGAAVVCTGCGALVQPGRKFCGRCGTHAPAPPPVAAPAASPGSKCGKCGAEIRSGKRFCGVCGAPADGAGATGTRPMAAVEAAARCPACGHAIPPGKRFCGGCGAPIPSPTRVPAPQSVPAVDGKCPGCGVRAPADRLVCFSCGTRLRDPAPPLPRARTRPAPRSVPAPPVRGRIIAFPIRTKVRKARSAGPGLGPVPPPWPFQAQTSKIAGDIANSASVPTLLGRMIRASLLDAKTFREVAESPAAQIEAWAVLGLIILAGIAASLVLAPSAFGILLFVRVAVVQVAGWLARPWAIQAGAAMWLRSRVSFNHVFRAASYAQAPALLSVVPIVGQVVSLWCLVTGTAAIRDITGCDTWKAAVLSLVGLVAAVVAGTVLSPLLGLLM